MLDCALRPWRARVSPLLAALLLTGADAGPPPLTEALPPGAPISPQAPSSRPPLVRRVKVDPRRLDTELRALARQAARSGARVLVELGAPWCEPCGALEAAFARESNRPLLVGWWLVEVDVDALPPGPVLGRRMHTVPALLRVGPAGRPERWLEGSALPTESALRLDEALGRFLAP